jgi:hypothetical protein
MSAVVPAGMLGRLLAAYRGADAINLYIAGSAAGIVWIVVRGGAWTQSRTRALPLAVFYNSRCDDSRMIVEITARPSVGDGTGVLLQSDD